MATTMGAVMGDNMEEEIILETERLALRRLRRADYADLCLMLKDEEVMYAYEHAFEDWEAADWLDRQLMRYEKYGFGLWAVILKESGELIGQCGLTMQEAGEREVLEVSVVVFLYSHAARTLISRKSSSTTVSFFLDIMRTVSLELVLMKPWPSG